MVCPRVSAVAMMAAASCAIWSEERVCIDGTSLDAAGSVLRRVDVCLGVFQLAGGAAVHLPSGQPLGVQRFSSGQQAIQAVAIVDQASVVDPDVERGHLRSGFGTQPVDQLTELSACLGVPHWPGAVALAVCECVVRPGLVGFAGGILGPWHVAGDLDPWRSAQLPLAVSSVSGDRQAMTGILIGTLITG